MKRIKVVQLCTLSKGYGFKLAPGQRVPPNIPKTFIDLSDIFYQINLRGYDVEIIACIKQSKSKHNG